MISQGELPTVTVLQWVSCEVSILQTFLCIFTLVSNSIDFSAGYTECSLRNVIEKRTSLWHEVSISSDFSAVFDRNTHILLSDYFNQLHHTSAPKKINCHKIEITTVED